MLPASPSSIFHTKFTILEWKSKYVLHPNGNLTWTTSGGVLNWVSKFYSPTDSEHKFYKMWIENWLLIGFNPGPFWLGTRDHNHNTMQNH